MKRPVCQWCGKPIGARRPSSPDGYHLDCTPIDHPHARELLSGERTPRSRADEVISGDEDLCDAISERARATLDELLSVLTFDDLAVAS